MTLSRTTPLRRTKPMAKSKKRMASRNPAQTAKRRKRRPRVSASTRREMLEEAGYQCTEDVRIPPPAFGYAATMVRCPETEALEIHHEHYKQTKENPKDGLKVVCRYHHHLLESQLRPWNVGRLGR